MEKKVKYKQGKVTPAVFDAVKILFQSNESVTEIAKFMKMSLDTVRLIRDAGSYDEYKNMMYMKSSSYREKMKAIKAKENEKQIGELKAEKQNFKPVSEEPPKQIVEYRQNVTVQATHYMMEDLKKIIELLTVLNNKIGFIVDELTK